MILLIHLLLQIFISCYWLFTIYNIYTKRKYLSLPLFFGLIFSAFAIFSVLIMELILNKADLTFNNWGWYPTNILVNKTFILVVNEFKHHKKQVTSIKDNIIEQCNLNFKKDDI